MAVRIAFLVCENFVEEANRALEHLGFDDACVMSFPARCGRLPLSGEECAAIVAALDDIQHVEIIGSCCLSGLDMISAHGCPHRVNRLDSCFEFIAESQIIAGYLNAGAYLTSPGWLKTWQESMERQGLDRHTARRMFDETITSVVLLDTMVAAESAEQLRHFAEFLDKPYDVYLAGLSVPKLFLTRLVMELRLEQRICESRELRSQTATHAMALDLMANLTNTVEEEQAVIGMMDAIAMLFAPQQVCYLTFLDDLPDRLWAIPPLGDNNVKEAVRRSLARFTGEGRHTESGNGFMLRATRLGKVRGVIMVEGVACPQYLDQYQNLAIDILNIGCIAIDNAHSYQQLVRTEKLLKQANEDLYRLSTTDRLTNVFNRRAYDEYLEAEWKRMLREQSELSLIVCDIDFFKGYNDLYGHEQGDICLHAVAQIISRSAVRPSDFVARYGGEEFVVVLPNTPLKGALHVAKRIRTTVEKSLMPHGKSAVAPYVTISLGVSSVLSAAARTITAATLFNAADEALYLAKKQGRNCIRSIPAVVE